MKNKKHALRLEMIALGMCFVFGIKANATTEDTSTENIVTNITIREVTDTTRDTNTQTATGTTTDANTQAVTDIATDVNIQTSEYPATNITIPKVTKGYAVAGQEDELVCTYNGELQKDVYFAIKDVGKNYKVVKPFTKNSVIFYFDKEGIGTKYTKSRFVKIAYQDSQETYYSDKGNLLSNTIAGNKAQGYYYVDSDGIKVTSEEVKLAVKFVRAHTESDWSQSKKLRACFDYLWKNYTYERFYDSPSTAKMPSYAEYMFTKKRGNCFRYGASFAYIAKVLGYDVRVAIGQISSSRGGMTPHGWTEINMDGNWYMFDANMQRNIPSISSYKKTDYTYAYRHSRSATYKMTVKNGKVRWEK